jgi:hypothetical protein
MGDVLSGVFGGGGTQKTDNTIDPQSQEANKLRVNQLQGLFGEAPLSEFAAPRPDIYTGAPAVDSLFSTANAQNQAAVNTAGSSFNPYSMIHTDPSQPANNYDNLMNLDQYIALGLNQSGNYINQIAKPEILQTAALQGLEGGGFVADAIARATAGVALPFIQGLPGASTSLTLAKPQAEATRAGTALTDAQRRLTGAQTGSTIQGIDTANAQKGLIQSQSGLIGAQRAGTLFPLADYGRGLGEADLARQQNVALAGLTGIPFTPVTDSTAKKNSQPLFNFFGQG